MKDSNIIDDDGFFVQEYYIHFLPAIFPKHNLSNRENAEFMCRQNYDLWVNVYENFYKKRLCYKEEIG